MTQKTFTQDQVDIMLIKQKTEGFDKLFDRIDSRFSSMESQMHWITGLVMGLYGLFIPVTIGVILKYFGAF